MDKIPANILNSMMESLNMDFKRIYQVYHVVYLPRKIRSLSRNNILKISKYKVICDQKQLYII